MKPDHRRIHELEYQLGFRDDPPPSCIPSTLAASSILKQAWMEAEPVHEPVNPLSNEDALRYEFQQEVAMFYMRLQRHKACP
jgi:hypothetical protein